MKCDLTELTDVRMLYTDNWMNTNHDIESWRRACGCIKTSDKLKQILQSFPTPPPPSVVASGALGARNCAIDGLESVPEHPVTCISAYCKHASTPAFIFTSGQPVKEPPVAEIALVPVTQVKTKATRNKSVKVVSELVSLVQLSVTATALALYYLLYCYMQLVYYTLRSALYFHNADGPMKITIGVVTLTSILIGFNVIVKMERMAGILSPN